MTGEGDFNGKRKIYTEREREREKIDHHRHAGRDARETSERRVWMKRKSQR